MVKYDTIDSVYSSLSDATRREILLRIGSGTLDLQEIAAEQKISLPAVSKHLKVLENSKLIVRERVGREYRFTLSQAAKYWVRQFQQLEKFLKEDINV